MIDIGQWISLPGNGSYASYDFDISLKDWVEAKPSRQRSGAILRPASFVPRVVDWRLD